MLTPSEVRRLLDVHGLAPSKSRGQNFVVDPNTVRKVVRDAGVGDGDLVVEVGPGLGSLTLALREAGARVVAVEVDAGMVRALGEVVGDDPLVRVELADAVTVDHQALVGGETATLVANLPYNVATPILFGALDAGVYDQLLVMVQKEVGRRWAAQRGHPLYGAVSVKLAALAEAAVVGPVSRNAFHPVPNVDSVTVRVRPRRWTHAERRPELFAVVEAGFGQRRKLLRNALGGPERSPATVEDALARVGLPATARAEELDLPDWVGLAAALSSGPATLPPRDPAA